ncbi:hypothetical protein SCHPADRAFT_906820 [Schizopora paradoxa]|uniref:Uncharacterized protein n=1 Tax=Schizopora paradoxa TaxID=27342 RepID=A0A0H2RFD5_9AGAM|nr:hypothetical protein SCHPADRAFT_906820 [Schizopora paradoxa]
MIDDDRNETNSSSSNPAAGGEKSGIDSHTTHSQSSSSFLKELCEDSVSSITYSYASTWSSNYTMSNLAGPGRILGNFYSRAGSALERRIAKWANRSASKEYEKAVAAQEGYDFTVMFFCEDPKEHERACEMLLVCAKSDEVEIQLKAFTDTIQYFLEFPSDALSAFRNVFKRRQEFSDVVTFSWKRPGVEYTMNWLCRYKMASRCLSSHDNLVIEAAAKLNTDRFRALDFSSFEEIFLCCSDSTDLLLSVRLIGSHWNQKGIEEYVRRKGFDGVALLSFAKGIIARWELYFSLYGKSITVWQPFDLTDCFIYGMWRCLRDLETQALDDLSEDHAQLETWLAVFKIHYFVRSCRPPASEERSIVKSWENLSLEYLPNSEQSKLCNALLRLGSVHDPVMRKRFPPQEGSQIDVEEKTLIESYTRS